MTRPHWPAVIRLKPMRSKVALRSRRMRNPTPTRAIKARGKVVASMSNTESLASTEVSLDRSPMRATWAKVKPAK
jgi:hypothetical protein